MTQAIASGTSSGPGPGLQTDKHVLFGLAGETYCVNLLQLQEVIAEYQITVLPNVPDYFHGVIGLRGEVIPILSLRKRFGFPGYPRDARTRVLVVDMDPNPIGVQVDEVFRVVSIAQSSVGHTPEFSAGQRTPFVLGVSEYGNGRLAIHLNMREVLSSLEKVELAKLTESIRASYESGLGRPATAAPSAPSAPGSKPANPSNRPTGPSELPDDDEWTETQIPRPKSVEDDEVTPDS